MAETKKEVKLSYESTNAAKVATQKKLSAVMKFAQGYKTFLDSCKIEREAVRYAIDLAEKKGYVPFEYGKTYKAGDKVYYDNRGKSVILANIGSASPEEGFGIVAAHIDSPRIDLKPNPLCEKDEIAYFTTHYYGGIKKYQWLTVPLALHGVIVKKDGSKVEVKVGEKDDDPIFYVTDLLPHLSQEQNEKKVSVAFNPEKLNILVGAEPLPEEEKDAVKKSVLAILNKLYGICEEDFLSAEIEAVPALKARDVGFDRALVASYGHDDRVCAYPEITATLQTKTDRTVMTILADKEEIGSEGNTGMKSSVLVDIIAEISKALGADPAVVRANSKCLSADVSAGFDPHFPEVYEKSNSAILNDGVVMMKFTGRAGKSGTDDASAEFVASVRRSFDENGVNWQTAELGKVDEGGGGTVAMYIANSNIDTVDIGVPVLSMHAPFEVITKFDLYSAYLAFLAFGK